MIPADWIEIPQSTIDALRENERQSVHRADLKQFGGVLGAPIVGIPVHFHEGRWYIHGKDLSQETLDLLPKPHPPGSRFPFLDIQEVNEEGLTDVEDEIERTCPWCGHLAESVEALAVHDETCE